MITDTSPVTTEHTQAVCFIHHDTCIVFVFQTNNLRQVSQITFHRENPVHHNQFHRFRFTLLKFFLKGFHIIVLVFQLGGERKATSVYDGSMVTVITDNVVIAVCQARYHTFIYSKTGRINQCIIFPYEFRQFLF